MNVFELVHIPCISIAGRHRVSGSEDIRLGVHAYVLETQ